jgi:hypothetical protein
MNSAASMNSSRGGIVRTVLPQSTSATTVVYIVGFLALALGIVYLYYYYKSFQEATVATVKYAYPDCPNYWESVGNGKCQNVNFLGSCAVTPGSNMIDFSGEIFTNANTGAYAKCKWSQACNMSWSGIDRVC